MSKLQILKETDSNGNIWFYVISETSDGYKNVMSAHESIEEAETSFKEVYNLKLARKKVESEVIKEVEI